MALHMHGIPGDYPWHYKPLAVNGPPMTQYLVATAVPGYHLQQEGTTSRILDLRGGGGGGGGRLFCYGRFTYVTSCDVTRSPA